MVLKIVGMKKLLIGLTVLLFYAASCQKDSKNQEYLNRLIEYSNYDYTEENEIVFTYMDSSSMNLHNLKQKYDLETIAGNGDEISRITNLMFWVNENLEHDGSSENPDPPNAENIIETCINENRGVNCRMLATVLNDFYLAMGFKSRHITCMPYEHEFDDCHVVNLVYSTQFDKWIMIDPSFAGFFQDEYDYYLGLSEIREKLIKDELLIISNHLNHNGKGYSKDEYRTYMSKNLFRFSCPAKSEYNYESLPFEQREYVDLIPLDYIYLSKSNHAITRNPDIFWVKP